MLDLILLDFSILQVASEELLREEAHAGKAKSWFRLSLYLEKTGHPPSEADEALTEAVKRGYEEALERRALKSFFSSPSLSGLQIVESFATRGRVASVAALGFACEEGCAPLIRKNVNRAAAWYKKGLLSRHPVICFRLAVLLLKGGVNGDYPRPIPLLLYAAESHVVEAQCEIGLRYLRGDKVEQDSTAAVRWMEEAAAEAEAEEGLSSALPLTTIKAKATAMFWLGNCYEEGNGVEQSLERAIEYYKRAAIGGDERAACNLGVLAESGSGMEKDETLAFSLFHLSSLPRSSRMRVIEKYGEKVLKSGEWVNKEEGLQVEGDGAFALAMYYLALSYQEGTGVEKSKVQARVWFKRAANSGSAAGMSTLGVYLERGWGGEKNEAEAAEWYRKAASLGSQSFAESDFEERGVTSALYNYGIFLEKQARENKGEGSIGSAIRYLRRAALRGNGDAQYRLFQLLRYSRKDRDDAASAQAPWKNDVEALHWCNEAANSGHPDAIHFLLNFEEMGNKRREAKDDEAQGSVIEWIGRTRQAKDGEAELLLGNAFYTGVGVLKDDDRAEKHFRRAAKFGIPMAWLHLGIMYENGRGGGRKLTSVNMLEYAAECYKRAIVEGDVAEAKLALGLLLRNHGQGSKSAKNSLALPYVEDAAAFGLADAKYVLYDILSEKIDGMRRGVLSIDMVAPMELLRPFSIEQRDSIEETREERKKKLEEEVKEMEERAKQLLDDAAAANCTDAMAKKAIALVRGEMGYACDVKEAGVLVEKVEESADSVKIGWLMFAKGVVRKEEGNGKEAAECFSSSVSAGYAPAAIELARLYFEGNGVPMNQGRGEDMLEKGVELGSAEAAYELAAALLKRLDEKGLRMMPTASNKSTSDAVLVEGRQMKRALALMKRAAAMGVLSAEKHLAALLRSGYGIGIPDTVSAAKWLKKAAAKGDVDAAVDLAHMLLRGKGVEQNVVEGMQWFRFAALQSHPEGCYNWGLCLSRGILGEPDEEKAVHFFQQGAAARHFGCCYCMGVSRLEGKGGERNEDEAKVHLSAALTVSGVETKEEDGANEMLAALNKASQPYADMVRVKPWLDNERRPPATAPAAYRSHDSFSRLNSPGGSMGATSRSSRGWHLPKLSLTGDGVFVKSVDRPSTTPRPPSSSRAPESRVLRYHRSM
mmetsp:Transcript_11942/g.32301  ORF Transcript_11942/g.32301 Transcript_11942/m.32301 type:complete len:1161 (-) Transcript_11942:1678-5160(-)